jgi:hypothetical protein
MPHAPADIPLGTEDQLPHTAANTLAHTLAQQFSDRLYDRPHSSQINRRLFRQKLPEADDQHRRPPASVHPFWTSTSSHSFYLPETFAIHRYPSTSGGSAGQSVPGLRFQQESILPSHTPVQGKRHSMRFQAFFKVLSNFVQVRAAPTQLYNYRSLD